MSKDNEKEIIEQLRKLPRIADQTDKDKIFQRVASRIDNEPTPIRKKKHNRYLPLIATAAVLILLISLPFLLTNMSNQTANDSANMNTANDSEFSIMQDEDNAEITGFSYEEEQGEGTSEIQESNEVTPILTESRVVNTIDNESQIIYFTIYDEQLQYTIPVSFIASNNAEITDYYNDKEEILSTYGLLPDQYLLEEVNYQLDFSEEQVTVYIPEDFTLGQGSAQSWMFQQLLEEMFQPYGIEKAIFEFEDNDTADIGTFGEITELDLNHKQQASYLLYENYYFIRIPQESADIYDAIANLQQDMDEFDIEKTVPEEVNYQLDIEGEVLIFDLITDEADITVTMIESILLTAKSYGYQYVQFKNMPISEIGQYYFSEPIEVPIGANPIIQ